MSVVINCRYFDTKDEADAFIETIKEGNDYSCFRHSGKYQVNYCKI